MSHTLPERFFDSDFRLLVIHDQDAHNIDMARLSLHALADLVADNAPRDCRVSLDRDQLAGLLETIATRLEGIPEVSFKRLTHARQELLTQGA